MHKQHVAHRYERFFCASPTYEFFFARDISILNVMMDGSMYPDGWHPCDRDQMRDNFLAPAKRFSRTERPPKYYFIDFGLSRRYDSEDKAPPLELPIRGGDKTVPEFQKDVHKPCNPFPTDIYYAGNLIRLGVMKVNMHFILCSQFLIIARTGIQRFQFHATFDIGHGPG